MIINKDNPIYEEMLRQLKADGVKVQYRNEFAGFFVEYYFDEDIAEMYIDTDVATLCQMTGNDVRELLKDYFKTDVSEKVIQLCEKLDFVDKGDCPHCGGWLEDECDWECEEGDHRGEIYLNAVYWCALCGNNTREFDADATRDAIGWRDTMITLR